MSQCKDTNFFSEIEFFSKKRCRQHYRNREGRLQKTSLTYYIITTKELVQNFSKNIKLGGNFGKKCHAGF